MFTGNASVFYQQKVQSWVCGLIMWNFCLVVSHSLFYVFNRIFCVFTLNFKWVSWELKICCYYIYEFEVVNESRVEIITLVDGLSFGWLIVYKGSLFLSLLFLLYERLLWSFKIGFRKSVAMHFIDEVIDVPVAILMLLLSVLSIILSLKIRQSASKLNSYLYFVKFQFRL